MKIKERKTKIAVFNPHRNYDFLPKISLLEGEDPIEVVEQYKLLGQIIRTDLKTISNTEYICGKAFKRLWIVRPLKELGCETGDLLDVMRQQVISVLEQAVPYWGPLITKRESNMIERVFKTGLHIIYQEQYKTFTNALRLSKMKSLSSRRKDIIFKFIRRAIVNPKFESWFQTNQPTYTTRRTKPMYKKVETRTVRYERSAFPSDVH